MTAKKLFRAVIDPPIATTQASGISSSSPSIIVERTNFMLASAFTKSNA